MKLERPPQTNGEEFWLRSWAPACCEWEPLKTLGTEQDSARSYLKCTANSEVVKWKELGATGSSQWKSTGERPWPGRAWRVGGGGCFGGYWFGIRSELAFADGLQIPDLGSGRWRKKSKTESKECLYESLVQTLLQKWPGFRKPACSRLRDILPFILIIAHPCVRGQKDAEAHSRPWPWALLPSSSNASISSALTLCPSPGPRLPICSLFIP